MRVHVLAADTSGSLYYRIRLPVDAMARRYPEVAVTVETDADVDALRHPDGRMEVRELKVETDLLVMQRPLRQAMHEVARVAVAQGIPVIVELDDDFWTVSPHNMAAAQVDPRKQRWHNHEWLSETIKLASAITVTSVALARLHPQAYVLRNYMDPAHRSIRRADRPIEQVGWTGTLATHPFDLQEMGDALVGRKMTVIGHTQGVQRATGAAEVTGPGWIDGHTAYLQAIADHIDVGVVPLEMCAFNEAKSWIKGMELAAAGVPFVATPSAEYRLMNAYGGGLLAKGPGEWRRHLRKLFDGGAYYDRVRQAGIDATAAMLIDDHVDGWVEAWGRTAGA